MKQDKKEKREKIEKKEPKVKKKQKAEAKTETKTETKASAKSSAKASPEEESDLFPDASPDVDTETGDEMSRELQEAFEKGREAGYQQEHRLRIREQRTFRTRQIRMLIFCLIMAVACIVLAALLVHEVRKNEMKGEPVSTETLSKKLAFDAPGDLAEQIRENYVTYLKQAYILFGTYPDCSYFKVVAGVERDDLDFENDFHEMKGKSYLNYYPDGKKAGRVAVDVSEYQETIDWAAVKASGVQVAIIRAGFRGYGVEGNIKKDAYFDENMKGATEAGLEVGTYFFTEAVNYDEGVEEANTVLSMIKDYDVKQPIIIDTEKIEAEGVRANNISVEDRTQAILGFCETVEKAGYTPMIYASTYWFVSALDLSKLGKYEFWLAAYDTPQFPYHVEGWQYASDGSVPGINGNVDLNVWMR